MPTEISVLKPAAAQQIVTDAQTARNASQAAQGLSEDARDASVIAKNQSEDARDLAETYAGIVSRAASVAGLTDPTTLTLGDLGYVSGSGDDAVDGVYEVQDDTGNVWVRIGDTGLADKIGRTEFNEAVGSQQNLGQSTIAEGDATISSATGIILTAPIDGDGKVRALRIRSEVNKTDARILVYRPSVLPAAPGGATTRIVNRSVNLVAGDNILTPNDFGGDIAVLAGDLIGVSAQNALRLTVGGGGTSYYGLSGESPTIPAANTSNTFQFGFDIDIDYTDETPLGRDVKALLAGPDQTYLPTEGYILVWGVGQSNLAGRDTVGSQFTIPVNRSYKYDGDTDTLVTLAEPCGTDATALSGSGRTSPGSGLAQAVLDATRGRIGVIFVNTAIGGTSITTWQSGESSWTASVSKFTTAKSQIDALDLNIVGCIGVMIQGETDAANEMLPATYKTNVLNLLSQMQTETGMDDFKLVISQIAYNTSGSTSASYAAIRNAQAELARENANIIMAHAGAKHFSGSDFIDTLHYSAARTDEIGGALGVAVAAYGIGSRPTGLSE